MKTSITALVTDASIIISQKSTLFKFLFNDDESTIEAASAEVNGSSWEIPDLLPPILIDRVRPWVVVLIPDCVLTWEIVLMLDIEGVKANSDGPVMTAIGGYELVNLVILLSTSFLYFDWKILSFVKPEITIAVLKRMVLPTLCAAFIITAAAP